jgi:hypothetical protein
VTNPNVVHRLWKDFPVVDNMGTFTPPVDESQVAVAVSAIPALGTNWWGLEPFSIEPLAPLVARR